ncbi:MULTISPECIES: pyridoxal 5'-phosphate synthase glutaminase subunit PdxT [Mumia]|uniref:pyridoxal 5'-phosphate synthase glutaminase subunit PdxT n=1 Tax=Mumia TaxID=1546255 RepID=UPI0014204642|nr:MULTISPECIES: pyridoxal 5'-phosphate synthase glutaminase subunit PdxT [unclassified Mumia]QMW67942.1 pyridoxal 5'-phosphate synthase glutaminase subunit PdxT [Mumia sp. ZJ1417]
MSAVRVGVLALQGDVREHLRMLADSGAEPSTVRRTSELAAVDALVVPGGESTTIDKLSRAFDLREPIRERIAAGMPVLGTCAGMIMLADRIEGGAAGQQTFGGLDVTVRRNAFGRQVDSFETDLRVEGLDAPMHAVFIRAPWVESCGPGVEVLASVDRGEDGAHPVVVRQGVLLAASFHPEVGHDDRLHRMFVRTVHAAR